MQTISATILTHKPRTVPNNNQRVSGNTWFFLFHFMFVFFLLHVSFLPIFLFNFKLFGAIVCHQLLYSIQRKNKNLPNLPFNVAYSSCEKNIETEGWMTCFLKTLNAETLIVRKRGKMVIIFNENNRNFNKKNYYILQLFHLYIFENWFVKYFALK